ncbi:MAG: aminoacyl-tRNA deacylase [Bacillota bacterium]
MAILKLKDFLEKSEVKYTDIIHPLTFSAQETAAKSHVKGREFAKTVLILINDSMVMTVLPASHLIDFPKLKKTLRIDDIRLASETEFKMKFPDCEVGAMPPLGNLYGMDVYFSESLLVNRSVTFNAGTHTEAISIKVSELVRIINPKVLDFTKKVKL